LDVFAVSVFLIPISAPGRKLTASDYAGWIDKFAGQSFPADDGFYKIVRYEPLGVVAGYVFEF
jgi:hypothetical protein